MIRVAVDALGGDRAPRRSSRARSLRRPPRSSRSSFGPAGLDTHGLPLVETDAGRSRWTTTRSRPCARSPTRRSFARCGRRGRARPTRSSRPATPARCSPRRCCTSGGSPASTGPAIAVVIPTRQRPERPHRRGRERRRAARAPAPVRAHGRRLRGGDPRRRRSRGRLLSIGEEDEKGNQLTLEANELLRASSPRLHREHREPAAARGRRGRRRHRRLHGQRRAEDARGDDQEHPRVAARRARVVRCEASSAGLLIRPAARARSASASIRRPTAAPTCSGCAASSSSRTARARASRSPMRYAWPLAGSSTTSSPVSKSVCHRAC